MDPPSKIVKYSEHPLCFSQRRGEYEPGPTQDWKTSSDLWRTEKFSKRSFCTWLTSFAVLKYAAVTFYLVTQELAFFQLYLGHLPNRIAPSQQRHVCPRPSGLLVGCEKSKSSLSLDLI